MSFATLGSAHVVGCGRCCFVAVTRSSAIATGVGATDSIAMCPTVACVGGDVAPVSATATLVVVVGAAKRGDFDF